MKYVRMLLLTTTTTNLRRTTQHLLRQIPFVATIVGEGSGGGGHCRSESGWCRNRNHHHHHRYTNRNDVSFSSSSSSSLQIVMAVDRNEPYQKKSYRRHHRHYRDMVNAVIRRPWSVLLNRLTYTTTTTTATTASNIETVAIPVLPVLVVAAPNQQNESSVVTAAAAAAAVGTNEAQPLQRGMTYYERTTTFMNGIMALYYDYQRYQTISATYQTARSFLCSNHCSSLSSTNTTNTTHVWAQRYQTLYDESTRRRRHDREALFAAAAVSLILPSPAVQTNPLRIQTIVIPYRQQQQQYQFIHAIQTVTPTVLFAMIPIIGYLPMLLAVVLPQQLLCRHFYNTYEIIQYNYQTHQQQQLLLLQQQKQQFDNDTEGPTALQQCIQQLLLQRQQSQYPLPLPIRSNSISTTTTASGPIDNHAMNTNRRNNHTTMTTIPSTNGNTILEQLDPDETNDLVALYRTAIDIQQPRIAKAAVTAAAATNGQSSLTIPVMSLLQLNTYPRKYLITLALATGLYAKLLPNNDVRYFVATHCTSTVGLREYIRTIVKRMVHSDQSLLCEELLAMLSIKSFESSSSCSSYIQNNMTDIELSDACLLRGLQVPPMDILPNTTSNTGTNGRETMIQSLLEHVQLVATLLQATAASTNKNTQHQPQDDSHPTTAVTITDEEMERIGLFVLQIPIIRLYLKQGTIQTSQSRNEPSKGHL